MGRVFLGSCEYIVKSMLKNIVAVPNFHSFSVYISYESLPIFPILHYFLSLFLWKKLGATILSLNFIQLFCMGYFHLACIFLFLLLLSLLFLFCDIKTGLKFSFLKLCLLVKMTPNLFSTYSCLLLLLFFCIFSSC